MKSILVTGIGGVVAQGILRNIINLKMDVRLVGTNVTSVSPGNHLCDKIHKVPFAYDPDYINRQLEICKLENIDLIIPSTDYETYYLAANHHLFSCPIAAAPAEVTKFCLDKYENFLAFKKHGIPFADSALPSGYKKQFEKTVVKPREGRGSRNINIDPADPLKFDDTYVVQQYLEGPEITTSFYVTQSGLLHGLITLKRELEFGNTMQAEVVFEYDSEMNRIIKKMLEHYPFRGSCNIQSRVTPKGIIPFEINCRISGTNSIRSQFGFNDVQYTVEEYLLKKEITKPRIIKGSALRIMMDVIYPGKSLNEIGDTDEKFYIN